VAPIVSDSVMKVLSEMAVELTRLRQNECKHLCIENYTPEVFEKLIRAVRNGLYGS
jgi:hypothetical protein